MRGMFHRQPFLVTLPTVGVTVSDLFVAVSVSGRPIRITGVYRRRLDSLTGPDRRSAVLAAAAEANRVLRVPDGTPAVLALRPVEPRIHLALVDGWGQRPLPVTPDAEVGSALEQAGFVVERFDATPAALARFASCSTQHHGVLRAGSWAVRVSADALTAEVAGEHRPTNRPSASADPAVPDLHGVRLPAAVRRHLSLDLDAAAIGAALRGFWFQPDLLVDLSPSLVTAMAQLTGDHY